MLICPRKAAPNIVSPIFSERLGRMDTSAQICRIPAASNGRGILVGASLLRCRAVERACLPVCACARGILIIVRVIQNIVALRSVLHVVFVRRGNVAHVQIRAGSFLSLIDVLADPRIVSPSQSQCRTATFVFTASSFSASFSRDNVHVCICVCT